METTSYIDEQLKLLIPIAVEGQDLISRKAWAKIDELLDCRQTLLGLGRTAIESPPDN